LLEQRALVAEAGIDGLGGNAGALGNGGDGRLLPAVTHEDLPRSLDHRDAGAGGLFGTTGGAVAPLLLDSLLHWAQSHCIECIRTLAFSCRLPKPDSSRKGVCAMPSPLSRILHTAVLVVVSLLVGAMFGVWRGYDPAMFSPATFVEVQQGAIRGLNDLLPFIGL